MRVVKIQAGQYQTEDGRYNLEQQPYERECECISCTGAGICPYGGIATDWFWIVWDNTIDDYAGNTGPCQFDTLREAKEYVQT